MARSSRDSVQTEQLRASSGPSLKKRSYLHTPAARRSPLVRSEASLATEQPDFRPHLRSRPFEADVGDSFAVGRNRRAEIREADAAVGCEGRRGELPRVSRGRLVMRPIAGGHGDRQPSNTAGQQDIPIHGNARRDSSAIPDPVLPVLAPPQSPITPRRPPWHRARGRFQTAPQRPGARSGRRCRTRGRSRGRCRAQADTRVPPRSSKR